MVIKVGKERPDRTFETADEVAAFFDRLWPLPRSITGEGVRASHDILGEIVPLQRTEIPSGTRCFDWTVPKEWIVREAYVVTPTGERILDFSENNLHLVNYSMPFRGRMTRRELDSRLFSLPSMPEAIPYRTSYYKEDWGFCISQNQRDSLAEGEYEVVVDSNLVDGSMTISECVFPGETEKEVLLSTYTCHPSMANNELSGPLVTAFLARRLAALPRRRLTYRFIFQPETIGAIATLHRIGDHWKQLLVAGYVISCVGIPGPFTYKKSRRGDTLADRACNYILANPSHPFEIIDFHPTGSDERQYCSPGFDLPVGLLTRGLPATYPQYHTSLDNRDVISFEAICESVDMCYRLCLLLDSNCIYQNQVMYGEPHLSKYDLYPTLGGSADARFGVEDILWLMSLADGSRDLLAIAERSGLEFDRLAELAKRCVEVGLLKAEEVGS
jgi:aminopeptidase-like protein